MGPRIIGLSGTPGTGKSTLARLAAVRLGLHVVELGALAQQAGALSSFDGARKSWDIDLDKLQKAVDTLPHNEGTTLLVGHAAHLLDTSLVVVLRTDPRILHQRLQGRGWSDAKIAENVEAETLDTITVEAVAEHGLEGVVELDTSAATLEVLLGQLSAVLAGERAKYRPGGIDYSWQLLGPASGGFERSHR